jgi:signal transduction histidine kinase
MAATHSGRFLSLSWRLPLVILALLLTIGSAYVWMAYRSMEGTLRARGSTRLLDAAKELSEIFAQAATARLADSRRVADDAAIGEFVSSGNGGPAVLDALQKLAARSPNTTITLRVRSDSPVVRLQSANVLLLRGADALDTGAARGRDLVHELHAASGHVFYSTEVQIPAAEAAGHGPYGRLTIERALTTSSSGITLIQRLLGNDAHIRLGNARGDVWTEVGTPIAAPPVTAGPGTVVSFADAGGIERLGAAIPVTGTPWMVWVDFSEATLLAPAKALAWRMSVPTLIVALLGLIAVRSATKRITDRLERAADAADGIASGDYSLRLDVKRHDELGRLAAAFNDMASRVGDTHGWLEARVQERTRELEIAREELQQHAAHLTTVNKELEAFSYSVSHDLRAPLRSIDGFSQALLEDCGPNLDAEGRDHLSRIRRAAQRMGHLIDDLLNLARVARAEMQWEEVDLSAMATKVLDGLAAADPARRVEYKVQPDIRSTGDTRLLQVALTNLLENAWKFTGRREHGVIEFGAERNGHGLVYYVRDNGAGFDMAYSNKLFGAFQRLHNDEHFPGTGIGLATVQRIVTRHGGKIWAEGQTDKSAAFYFTLQTEAAA